MIHFFFSTVFIYHSCRHSTNKVQLYPVCNQYLLRRSRFDCNFLSAFFFKSFHQHHHSLLNASLFLATSAVFYGSIKYYMQALPDEQECTAFALPMFFKWSIENVNEMVECHLLLTDLFRCGYWSQLNGYMHE